MNILEAIGMGLSQLRMHKLRSALSLTGILIAVGSVIGIVSIGAGVQGAVEREFEQLGGYTLLWTYHETGYRDDNGNWIEYRSNEQLTNRDAEVLAGASDRIESVTPYLAVPNDNGGEIRHKSVVTTSAPRSSTEGYLLSENWMVAMGRFIDKFDLLEKARVCVLGNQVAVDLFGSDANPVGDEVKIGGDRYTVIGVMEQKTFFDNNYDNRVILPITTVQQRVTGDDVVSYIQIQAKSPDDVPMVQATIQQVLNRMHRGHGEEFAIHTAMEQLEEINMVLNIMQMVAGGIAGISLVVGLIGIMNIMLVSVTERTGEIGVRLALGARRTDIMAQFIIEATVLCFVGGLLGVSFGYLLGQGLGAAISQAAGMTFTSEIPTSMMIGTLAFSGIIGLTAGVYPAWRASRLDPVEALRYE